MSGHVAEVAAPIEEVHVNPWCVRELHKEDPVTGDRADRGDVEPACQRVERVEYEPNVRVIGPPYDFPRVAVVVDVAPQASAS